MNNPNPKTVDKKLFTNLQLEFQLSGSTICWSAFSDTSNRSVMTHHTMTMMMMMDRVSWFWIQI